MSSNAFLDLAVSALEDAGLVVSRGSPWEPGGKTVVTASSARLLAEMSTLARARGVSTNKRARHLGVDFGLHH